MLICRCAWHRRYRGYPLLHGVASWRGWGVKFTDGICERCLERFRAEHRRYLVKKAVPEMAPLAPQRSERPGKAVALVGSPPAA